MAEKKKKLNKKANLIALIVIIIGLIIIISSFQNSSNKSSNDNSSEISKEDIANTNGNSASDLDITFYKSVRNDKTQKWRYAIFSKQVDIQEYVISYYKTYFQSDDEIHGIINFSNNTTTKLSTNGSILFCEIHDYVKDEEHDANLMFSGTLLSSYQIDIATGEITKIQ